MSVPLTQLTVEEAHKEFNSLADRIATKYEQLDSSEFWTVGSTAFNTKSAKLAVLFAHMNQLCQALKRTFGSKFCAGRQVLVMV